MQFGLGHTCSLHLPASGCTIQVGDRPLAESLARLLSYDFALPESALRRGLVYTGTATRLRRAVTDMLLGKRPVKIGIIGAPFLHPTHAWSNLIQRTHAMSPSCACNAASIHAYNELHFVQITMKPRFQFPRYDGDLTHACLLEYHIPPSICPFSACS